MAREKKNESATSFEEKVARMLVPDWEQPYKIPKNWCWTRLAHVARWGSGGTPSRRNPAYYEGSIPWIKTGELNDGYIYETEEHISEEAIENSSAKLFPANTVVIAMYGATIGKVGIMGIESTTNQACACAVASPAIDYKYLFYYAQSQKDAFIKKGKGGAQPNISQEIIKDHEIPLPPLAEQRRIVSRIEDLFEKLDETREKAQTVLDSFETRKAAILHKAFTGELTAKWRAENGVRMESWEEYTVGSVCHEVKVGIVIKPSQYYTDEENGTPAFRSANVRENHIDDFDWVYLNRAGMDNNTRSIVHTGDVLVVRSGNPGTACVVTDKFDGYNAIDILIAVPDHTQVTSEFLCYYTNSPFGKNLVSENKRGMALAHFNVKGYSSLPIRIPLLKEQTEIVHILDSLFAKEQQAKEAAEAVLEQIDLLKKNILARAFRGELDTNNPVEENAAELLRLSIGFETEPRKRPRATSIPKEFKQYLKSETERKIVKLYFQKSTDVLPIDILMTVSADTFVVIEALRTLDQRNIINKQSDGNYKLMR